MRKITCSTDYLENLFMQDNIINYKVLKGIKTSEYLVDVRMTNNVIVFYFDEKDVEPVGFEGIRQ